MIVYVGIKKISSALFFIVAVVVKIRFYFSFLILNIGFHLIMFFALLQRQWSVIHDIS